LAETTFTKKNKKQNNQRVKKIAVTEYADKEFQQPEF
jgi:hypothetical protein